MDVRPVNVAGNRPVDLSSLAQVGPEAAIPTQPGEPACPRPGNHEAFAADDIVLDCPRVLEQERALATPDGTATRSIPMKLADPSG